MKVEEELRESQRKLATLLGNLPGMAYRCQNDREWTMEFVSDGCFRLTGYYPRDLEQNRTLSFRQLIHQEDQAVVWNNVQSALRLTQAFQIEYRIITAQGFEKWVWEQGSAVFSPDGKVLALEGVITDITERKQLEDELQKYRERFTKIFKSNPCMMSIKTLKDRRYLDVNQNFERITGYSCQEVLGITAKDINLWQDPEEETEFLNMLMKQYSINNMEVKLRAKSGGERTVLLSGEIMEIGGEKCVVTAGQDISAYSQLKNEITRLDSLNLVGEMAAGIGHEIRNPMTAIKGFLQMLKNKQECQQYKQYFDLMLEELDRVNAIISEFLSLAKNKTANFGLHNLNSIAEALFPLIQSDAVLHDKSVNLDLKEVPDLLLDEKEIRQLILNLVRNGLEAMDPGGNLTLATYTDGKDVVLAVQDEGKGIDENTLDKLGTPFFTTKADGIGLGLAVCYSVAARHKAAISVDTGAAGTTFFVRFPIP